MSRSASARWSVVILVATALVLLGAATERRSVAQEPGAAGPTRSLPATTVSGRGPEGLSVSLSQMADPGPPPGDAGGERRVVVVNGDDLPSALAAAVLATESGGPLLVARPLDLTAAQKSEVARLRPAGAYLVGAPSRLSDRVVSSLVAAGARPARRVNGNDSADTARRIAQMLDRRDDGARARRQPAFPAVVVVNPQSPDAASGSALAAALHVPVLFTQRDVAPPATTETLASLDVATTLVVGGAASVGDPVVAQLPGAKRLGGADPTVTSEAVAAEAVARGVPAPVAYVVDGERPIEQVIAGAAAGRTGGIVVAEPDASAGAARRSLERAGLASQVQRLVVARSRLGGGGTALRVVLAAVISVIGIAVLVVALAHRDDTEPGNAELVPGTEGGPRVSAMTAPETERAWRRPSTSTTSRSARSGRWTPPPRRWRRPPGAPGSSAWPGGACRSAACSTW